MPQTVSHWDQAKGMMVPGPDPRGLFISSADPKGPTRELDPRELELQQALDRLHAAQAKGPKGSGKQRKGRETDRRLGPSGSNGRRDGDGGRRIDTAHRRGGGSGRRFDDRRGGEGGRRSCEGGGYDGDDSNGYYGSGARECGFPVQEPQYPRQKSKGREEETEVVPGQEPRACAFAHGTEPGQEGGGGDCTPIRENPPQSSLPPSSFRQCLSGLQPSPESAYLLLR